LFLYLLTQTHYYHFDHPIWESQLSNVKFRPANLYCSQTQSDSLTRHCISTWQHKQIHTCKNLFTYDISVRYVDQLFVYILKMLRRMWVFGLPKSATKPAPTAKHFQLSHRHACIRAPPKLCVPAATLSFSFSRHNCRDVFFCRDLAHHMK